MTTLPYHTHRLTRDSYNQPRGVHGIRDVCVVFAYHHQRIAAYVPYAYSDIVIRHSYII